MELHLVISQGPASNPEPILATSDPVVIRAALDALERRCFPRDARPARLRPVFPKDADSDR